MKKQLALISIAALSIAACGSSDGGAATATEGDAFCKLAQIAADDHDALDAMDITDPSTVKLQLGAAIDSLSAAAAKAPKDIVDTVKALLANQEELESLLEKNDFDVIKFSTTDEGKAFGDKVDNSTDDDDFDEYLTDKCGIDRSNNESSDTTPVDDTVAVDDTTGSDVTAGGDVGDDAINSFLDLYELGTNSTLSDEDRSCIVDALSGKVTKADLDEAISSGQPTAELAQALGLAFVGCNVEVSS